MGNLSVIGKVHIKDINALREWHASGDFKKWHKVNWSPELAAYHHIKWEDTEQIAFYQMQNQIPGLSESLDRTGSWMRDRKSTRLNSSHANESRMPSSA